MMLNQSPVTIDEVQRAPELFRYVKMECDQSEDKGLFCLSGSQQFVLMKNVSETLSGRVRIMEAFWRFMIAAAARTGEVLNYSHLADEMGKDVSTVKKWISILEASGVIYLLEPFTSDVLKRAIRAPKMYFRDTGLACYLTRWLTAETLACGAFSGHIFETFVISEILKSFANAGLDYRYFVSYYRGRDR